jgi:predicted TIM-barrel fold metal-dependent hydrolase
VIVDAHHHFWGPATADYPWLTGQVVDATRTLLRDVGRDELAAVFDGTAARVYRL